MRPKSHVLCQMSHVLCQKWHFRCHMSHVTCHLPPVTNANIHNNIPSPANSPIIGSKGRSRSKNLKTVRDTSHETTEIVWFQANLAIRPSTRSVQDSWKWVFHNGTDRKTLRQTHKRTRQLYDWPGPESRFSEYLVDSNNNFFFVVEVLAALRMSINQFEQKPSTFVLQGNRNCSYPKISTKVIKVHKGSPSPPVPA